MLIVSLVVSITIIQTSIEDWDKNPITTDVARTDSSHNTDDIFPAVTICRGPSTQPDNWALTDLILDFFDFHCNDGQGMCDRNDQIQNDFSDLMKARFKYVTEVVDDLFQGKKSQFDDYTNSMFHDEILSIVQSSTNAVSLTDFDEFLEENMFKFVDNGGMNFMNFITEKKELVLSNSEQGFSNIKLSQYYIIMISFDLS